MRRVDDLQFQGLRLVQDTELPRFTADSVLLANFLRLRPNDRAIDLGSGTGVLSLLGAAKTGSRGYLAVLGGIDVPLVMGSRSTNLKCKIGGYCGRALKAGDVLEIGDSYPVDYRKKIRSFPADDFSADEAVIRVVLGPQDDYFTKKGIDTFLNETYTVTKDSDRMGFKLDGEVIENVSGVDIVSDGIALGSIQVPSGGKPIIMLADRQTTGGYAKIATVVSVDIPKLVQLKPGSRIRFEAVSVKEAEKLYKKEQRVYEKLLFSIF